MSSFLEASTEGKDIPQSERRLDGGFEDRSFRVGQVVSDAFRVFFQNFFKNLIYMAVIAIPFALIGGGLVFLISSAVGATMNGEIAGGIVGVVIFITWYFAVQTGIIKSTVDTLSEHDPKLGEMISLGFSKMLPIIMASLLATVMISVGLLMLVIPGILVMTALFVFVPAIVVENKGIMESLHRSRELTSGYRWQVFGAYFVVTIISNIVDKLIEVVLGLESIFAVIVVFTVIVLTFGINSSLAASIYINLRRAKEGVDVSEISKVFE